MTAPERNLLHYRLVEKIGEGGMGVVWTAVDTSLGRKVAIKVLPGELSANDARLTRFEREARLIASLNHPNIATVHGLHEAEGIRFLAMELLSGEDLAQRLARGPVPLAEALDIASRIAEALDAAHESGVIHRDLKPANVQLTADGRVKVLDFGLAKAFRDDPERTVPEPSMSPTITSLGTVAGTILGTAGYMSPEQAKGHAVDKRADIWAFGVVLYEMLTGRGLFLRRTVAETLAAVLKEDPDWSLLPPGTPPAVRGLLRHCLEKTPRARLRDIGDARLVLRDAMEGGDTRDLDNPLPTAEGESALRRRLPWVMVVALAGALVGILVLRPSSTASREHPVHLTAKLEADEAVFLASLDLEVMPAFAIAPSGDALVYVALDPEAPLTRSYDARRLRRRPLGASSTEILRGSEGAEIPFYSPDGGWVGFFSGSGMFKIPASGGARVEIAKDLGHGTGASWGEDGTIVFAHAFVGPLWAVSAGGGKPEPLTRLLPGERSHRFPQHLPDGRSILFTIKPTGILSFDEARIAVADRRTGEHRVLPVEGTFARYVRSGHLVFGRDGGLLAAPFDLDTLEIVGGAVPVLDGVIINPVTGAAFVDFAEDGTLAFAPGDYRSGPVRLVRIGRDGSRKRLAEGAYVSVPHLSPDGERLVLHGSYANDSVVVLEIARDTLLRMTEPDTNNILPTWGPGGETILFTTDRSGQEEIVAMPAGGGPTEPLIAPCGVPQDAYDVSRDGRRIAIHRGVRDARDIWVWDRDRTEGPEPFLATPFNEGDPAFSPDGTWIAYTSDESGATQVYLSPYPASGRRIQVSSGESAFCPVWRGDGRELYYQDRNAIYAVPVDWDPTPRPGRARRLFDAELDRPLGFAVDDEGTVFYVVEMDEARWRATAIDVILDWPAMMRESAGGTR